ncbi:MlaA family lipoprotein [Bowmanella dokdonensis]|uniref:VacJ family lipoprotein n=1 Tax=Bowmanella dokdonensis TaxID=751969 RepID=A0A939DM61_9ALTE|nr:VacJ family lipoprotein [Bowmanella dokdonensis]MBN7825129.1 VacJ family lipoprotein [Bowmanella dokdonensis]
MDVLTDPLKTKRWPLTAPWMLLVLILSVGCASHTPPVDPDVTPQQPSANDKVVVVTPQGTDTLEPTVVGYSEPHYEDPLEGFNRAMFGFNDVAYRYVLIPVARGYNHLPSPIRTGVSNFFSNIREPWNSVNHALQGEGKLAGRNLGRFLVNSTLGLLGLFDPATHWFELKPAKSTLGEALAHHEVGYGAFLVLPFIGQTDFRSGFSTFTESTFTPLEALTDRPQTGYWQIFNGYQQAVPSLLKYEELKAQSEDPYLYFRNQYLQNLLRDQQYKKQAESADE